MKTLGCLFNLFLLTILIAGLIVILHGLRVDVLTLLKQALFTLPLITIGKATHYYQSTVSSGALSVDHKGHTLNSDTPGYAIGAYPERALIVPTAEFTPNTILEFVHKNHDLLSQPGFILGTWINDGHVYLDVSIIAPDLNRAKRIARAKKQLAVYNLATLETIYP